MMDFLSSDILSNGRDLLDFDIQLSSSSWHFCLNYIWRPYCSLDCCSLKASLWNFNWIWTYTVDSLFYLFYQVQRVGMVMFLQYPWASYLSLSKNSDSWTLMSFYLWCVFHSCIPLLSKGTYFVWSFSFI